MLSWRRAARLQRCVRVWVQLLVERDEVWNGSCLVIVCILPVLAQIVLTTNAGCPGAL